MKREEILGVILTERPDTLLVYSFGSAGTAAETPTSDADLAILLPRALADEARWRLQEAIARTLGRDCDLIDLANATTVMRKQVLDTGELLFESTDADRGGFEMQVDGAYLRLQELRRGILDDISERGTVL